MKKIKLLFDKLILNKLEKINPIFYRTIMFHLDKKYSEFVNSIKYKDKHFFNLVYLEISTYCNRKCSYCPNKYYDTPKEFMSWELIKHIVNELKSINYSGAISYCLYNEPLFDNRLKDIVEYINKNLPNSIQLLVSNGDKLTIDKSKELLNAGINKFIITKDGDIILCCNDYLKTHIMGNIKEKSLIEIWNSYKNLRKNILEKNIIELDICKKCLNIKGLS